VKLLTVRLDDDLHEAVMAKAAERSTNVSALVRRSLERWVEQPERKPAE
jgi:predicted HicB family RNase H-like nuclease